MHKEKVLFLLKKHAYGVSFGLFNSCQFVAQALQRHGIGVKVVEVADNNSIDHEVALYRPTRAIIEALWVVPEKFPVLIKLHPEVEWVVRIHSNTPFISGEGIAFKWINGYEKLADRYPTFSLASNSTRFIHELRRAINVHAEYLPNIYAPILFEPNPKVVRRVGHPEQLHIGCFGAIRPLKNQLEQAVAAMIYANSKGKQLYLHINHSRIEQNSQSILKNIHHLFAGTRHKVVEHEWIPHQDFLKLVQLMDCGMQLSFSETFNIIAADFVYSSIPIVTSSEIDWVPSASTAPATRWDEIVDVLDAVITEPKHVQSNKRALQKNSVNALDIWMSSF